MGRDSSTSLAPGFRFHPTDEEIVRYYLRRKVSGKSVRFDPISVTDIYKSEPWDLPEKSKLKTRDLEWYFFSPLDKKYGNSSRTNRATENGYWKTTGKDRPVRHNSRVAGMKKTLVYHSGRAPRGARSNWVMHEYRLTDDDLEKAGVVQDAFVLCRIFQKSGSGPKNGEQYGAPFVEEEWEEDVELTLPGEEVVVNEGLVDVVDDMHLEVDDIAQYFDGELPFEYAQIPSNYFEDTSNLVELPNVLAENNNKSEVCVGDTLELQRSLEFFQLPEQYGMGGISQKDECFAESSSNLAEAGGNLTHEDVDYLLDEPYPSVLDDTALNEESFLETNDLSNPVEADPIGFDMLEEYLTFFDADDDHLDLSFDPSEILGSEQPISGQTIPEEKPSGLAGNEFMATNQTPDAYINDASTSKENLKAVDTVPDSKSPFLKCASYMLGNIPAPPAFASEYPSKDMVRLNSAAQTPSSVHVTAGMIHIRNMTSNGDLVNSVYGKNADVNLILSFARRHQGGSDDMLLPQLPIFGAQSPKNGMMMGSRGGGFLFFFLLFWVLILSVSYRVGSCIYSH